MQAMPIGLQNVLVLLIVAACALIVLRQLVRTLRGGKSRVGQCCAKGCEPSPKDANGGSNRVVFLPAEMLRKSK